MGCQQISLSTNPKSMETIHKIDGDQTRINPKSMETKPKIDGKNKNQCKPNLNEPKIKTRYVILIWFNRWGEIQTKNQTKG